jgi:hypothetical protein
MVRCTNVKEDREDGAGAPGRAARSGPRAGRAVAASGRRGPADLDAAGARRAPAAYTREQIAETAIAIADAEGFEAVSMRRIAAELGAGTMTLYYYVRTKDELSR